MVGEATSGRERLLVAASALFGRQPYHEVGIAAVLERAGLKPPTLYYHFGDKEGLFVAWAETALQEVAFTVTIPEATFEQNLVAFARHLMGSVRIDVPMVMRDARGLDRPDSRERLVNAYAQALYEPLCAILLDGMEKGAIRSEPIARLADAFLAGSWELRGPGVRLNAQELAEWWVGCLLHGLSPRT